MNGERSPAYMDELPPARSRYDSDRKETISAALARAQDRRSTLRWDTKGNSVRLKPTALVCILDARDAYRDQQRIGGHGTEAEADQWFWDRFFASLLAGEFDGRARVHVVDDQPVIRMRFRSVDARALTSNLYSYDDIVRRRLARSWLARRDAVDWCQRHSLPVPQRWIINEPAMRKAGRPSITDKAMHEFERRKRAGTALPSNAAEARALLRIIASENQTETLPNARTIANLIGAARK